MEKEQLKKNATTGAATVLGAVTGVAAASFIFPTEAEAEEIKPVFTEHDTPDTITPKSVSTPHEHHSDSELPQENMEDPNPTITPEPEPYDPAIDPAIDPAHTPLSGEEVEVVGYTRIVTEDGPVDVADMIIDGNEVRVIDFDTDGYADLITHDFDHDGIIGDNEMINVEGMGIEMQPMQLAAGFDPDNQSDPLNPIGHDLQAGADLPDYVNDADIDSFMA